MEKFFVGIEKKIANIKMASNLEKFVKTFETREYVLSILIFSLSWAFAGNFTDVTWQLYTKTFRTTFYKKAGSLLNES